MSEEPAPVADMHGGTDAASIPVPQEGRVTGRYLADNGRWSVQLRIGSGEHPTVSADLQIRDLVGLVELSMITSPSTDGNDDQSVDENEEDVRNPDVQWLERPQKVNFTDSHGRASEGTVRIVRVPKRSDLIEVTFTIDHNVGSLVLDIDLKVTAARVSNSLRNVGLEVEYEEGTKKKYFTDELVKAADELIEVLHQTGLDVHKVGSETVIPAPHNGTWATSDVFTALNKQLRIAAQAPLTSPVWELHLMMLSKSDRQGLLGIMPDFAADLPRQGAAIFLDAIAQYCPDPAELPTRILTTAVHELGHCLNLTHRFTREVGHADSASFMNYDWFYRGGGQVDRYWSDRSDPVRGDLKKRRTFDRDELRFLRHGPREKVIPGGAAFGSARYWTTGIGGSVAPTANPERDLQLWMTPPPTGTQFNYLDPVFLQLSLRNAGDTRRFMPRHVLDIKAGMLEILIQRHWSQLGGDNELFMPIMRRCYSLAIENGIWLNPGESLHNNINLAFGSAGFPLAEPGEYLITPVLTLFNGYPDPIDPDKEPVLTVVEGKSLPISIMPPVSKAQRRDADRALRNDVGASLALGGADCLTAAADTLQDIFDRRRRDDRSGKPDGLVAATARMLGMHAARHDRRREAIAWLDVATHPAALATFDPHTAEHTRLRATQVSGQRATGCTAYLDLAMKVGSALQQRTIPAVLVTRAPSPGVEPKSLLLVDASAFTRQARGADAVQARAIVSASDGSTEEIEVVRLDFCGEPSDRAVAVAYLNRDAPGGFPAEPVNLPQWWAKGAGITAAHVRRLLRDAGIVIPAGSDVQSDNGPLGTIAAATQAAPWAAVGVAPAEVGTDDVLSWSRMAWIWCWFTNRCGERPLRPDEKPSEASPGRWPLEPDVEVPEPSPRPEVNWFPEGPVANPEDHEDTEQAPDQTRPDWADPITKNQTTEHGATEYPGRGLEGWPPEAAP